MISSVDFLCSSCNNRFYKERTLLEALQKFREDFPKEREVFARMVCGSCYEVHMSKMRLLQRNRVRKISV